MSNEVAAVQPILSLVLCRRDDAPEALQIDPRRSPRMRVRCHVSWDHHESRASQGEILDISAEGLFMGVDAALSEAVAVGDEVWGRLEVNGRQHVFLALVRWRGFSYAHDCDGIGLELRTPSHDMVWAVGRHARLHLLP